jgi:hypothetical protein
VAAATQAGTVFARMVIGSSTGFWCLILQTSNPQQERLFRQGYGEMKRRRETATPSTSARSTADQLVCWIADNIQLLPRRRTKVQTSVASTGCSLPETRRPELMSTYLSIIEKRIATLA